MRSWIRMVCLALSPLASAAADSSMPELGDLSKVGSVHVPISCQTAVHKDFDRGVALLHSFFYEEARRTFEAVAAKDPKCAMAHWGVAMTHYHPLWTPPSDEELKAGHTAIEKAKALGGK